MTTQATKAVERRERPIVFSGPMVRAILEGRKTQTRRVISPQPLASWMSNANTDWAEYYKRNRWGRLKKHLWITHPTENKEIICPYGQPGDHLWVRESLWVSECGNYFARQAGASCYQMDVFEAKPNGILWPHREYNESNYPHEREIGGWSNEGHRRAGAFKLWFSDCNPSTKVVPGTGNTVVKDYEALFLKKRSAIHMPRWASRITLEITDVRVERLQGISENDARAEGAPCQMDYETEMAEEYGDQSNGYTPPPDAYTYVGGFMRGWDAINAKRGYSWDSNPWIWAITFKRVNVPERETET